MLAERLQPARRRAPIKIIYAAPTPYVLPQRQIEQLQGSNVVNEIVSKGKTMEGLIT